MNKAIHYINDVLKHKSEILKCGSNLLNNYERSENSFINIIFNIIDDKEILYEKNTTMYDISYTTKRRIDLFKQASKLGDKEIKELILRGFYKTLNDHDNSKIYTPLNYLYNCDGMDRIFEDYMSYTYTSSEEYNLYKEASNALKGLEFGTAEYNKARSILDEGFKLHSKLNPHHPEYHNNGVNDMDLLSFMEMVIDWCSAALARGYKIKMSIIRSQAEKFNIDKQALSIIKTNIELIIPNINLIEYD